MLAWGLVIAMTGGICGLVISSQLFLEAPVEGNTTAMELMPIQVQVKALVGQKNLVEDGPPVQIPPELDSGPYEQRLCYSILLNELDSSTSALDHIEETEAKVENVDLKLTDEQKRLGGIVTDLMESYEDGDHDSSSIPVEDRDFLKERLKWVGELALYPADSPHTAERTKVISEARGLMIGGIIFMLLGFLIGFGGFVLALVFGVMLFAGKLTPHFKNHLTNHNIYIETFAIWMVLFVGISLGAQLLPIQDNSITMVVQPFVFFASLIALIWPMCRGVSFSQLRHDIGWTCGNPIKEVLSGVWIYLATLPFLVPGLVITAIVMALFVGGGSDAHEFARQSTPGHPIQEDIMSGNLVTIIFVFVATCIAAPIVEETMFRGVLLRHLRDWTTGWRIGASIVFASIVNAIIFASIHPQGLAGIPVLTILALGFSTARQWRGSLVGSMVMHAIHNFIVTCAGVFIL